MVNHHPSLLAKTKPLVDAPFILNQTANCGNFQNSVTCDPFSLVFLLFLSVLQASHSVVFLYLQNTIRFVSENTENVFSVLLLVQ